MWTETGGGRLAAFRADGPLTYAVEVNYTLCDEAHLLKVVSNVRDACGAWSAIIRAGLPGTENPAEAASSNWLML